MSRALCIAPDPSQLVLHISHYIISVMLIKRGVIFRVSYSHTLHHRVALGTQGRDKGEGPEVLYFKPAIFQNF